MGVIKVKRTEAIEQRMTISPGNMAASSKTTGTLAMRLERRIFLKRSSEGVLDRPMRTEDMTVKIWGTQQSLRTTSTHRGVTATKVKMRGALSPVRITTAAEGTMMMERRRGWGWRTALRVSPRPMIIRVTQRKETKRAHMNAIVPTATEATKMRMTRVTPVNMATTPTDIGTMRRKMMAAQMETITPIATEKEVMTMKMKMTMVTPVNMATRPRATKATKTEKTMTMTTTMMKTMTTPLSTGTRSRATERELRMSQMKTTIVSPGVATEAMKMKMMTMTPLSMGTRPADTKVMRRKVMRMPQMKTTIVSPAMATKATKTRTMRLYPLNIGTRPPDTLTTVLEVRG